MLLTALLLAASAAPVPATAPADWQPVIKDRAFKFEEKKFGAAYSIEAAKKAGLTAEYIQAAAGLGEGSFTFQKKGGPKVNFGGHEGTSVVVHGDAVYVADYVLTANGCRVVAYDLTTGKKAWEKRLAGIGNIDHFKYSNRVAMAAEKHPSADNFALVIVGHEESGRYIEVLDFATGKQLAHRKYGQEK